MNNSNNNHNIGKDSKSNNIFNNRKHNTVHKWRYNTSRINNWITTESNNNNNIKYNKNIIWLIIPYGN